MNKTKIEWCDATWNPVTGCLYSCEYCYARKMANRFGHGNGEGITHFLGETMSCPVVGKQKHVDPYPFGFDPTFHRYLLDKPQHWRKPHTIFVCSMADLFGEWVPDEWIEAVFAACEKAPQHRYLFLTKNPRRYVELARNEKLPRNVNMWYGSTVTSNEMKAFSSLDCNTFVSIEPLLAPVNLCDASCVNPSRQKRDSLKSTSELLNEIISNGYVSDTNLRMLLNQVKVFNDEDGGIDVVLEFNGDFKRAPKRYELGGRCNNA